MPIRANGDEFLTKENTKENPFYLARIRAAERDTTFESRESAGVVLGISSTRLYQIERGLREPHRDELIVMSMEYRAPHLLSYYCQKMCSVGVCIMKEGDKGGKSES